MYVTLRIKTIKYKQHGGGLLIDFDFWRVVKSHTWLDDTTLYLLRRDEMFAIVLTSSDDTILDTFTTFDSKYASITYNNWKDKIMKHEWFEEI